MSEKRTGSTSTEEGGASGASGVGPAEGMRRFTLDLPLELHRAIKLRSFEEGTTMAKLVRECLENCMRK